MKDRTAIIIALSFLVGVFILVSLHLRNSSIKMYGKSCFNGYRTTEIVDKACSSKCFDITAASSYPNQAYDRCVVKLCGANWECR